MRKITTLATAALAIMCNAAAAGSVTVQLTSYCDEYTLRNTGALYAIRSVHANCDAGLGGGTVGRVKGSGKLITTGMILNGSDTKQYVWTFSTPLANGGTATLYYTTDGKMLNFLIQSTYNVVTPGARRNVDLPPATRGTSN